MSDNDNFYKDQFNQLSTKVNELVSYKAQNNFSLNYNINTMYIYLGLPIILTIYLIISKPNIVMTEIKNGKTFFTETKLSYFKVAFIISLLILFEVVVYFILNINKKKNK